MQLAGTSKLSNDKQDSRILNVNALFAFKEMHNETYLYLEEVEVELSSVNTNWVLITTGATEKRLLRETTAINLNSAIVENVQLSTGTVEHFELERLHDSTERTMKSFKN
ncbi:unnamed protein product [Toxocara canis]|uniref:DUF2807 domain-containing protein n=1 Tax=Toxocara canis TaxID=6265 RepID=A0A183UC96_TOXCA|nr:unnamed protein product [Toxocara canis]